ncbi:MAG TPA: aspartyl protease family protein [Candidatus Eisenbacteria bacterium]
MRTAALVAIALLVAGASAARAEIQDRARPVVERYLAATGGSAARVAETTLRFRGRIVAAGLTGRWEMWLAAPDHWARRMTLGSLRLREGFDGTTAWHTDLSGKEVTVLSGSEASEARAEGWFLNERWALEDQGGGRIRAGSTAFGASASYDVIDVVPPVGRSRRMFIDQKTGLITRVVEDVDQQTVEERPGAYRKLGGRLRATVYAAPTLLPSDRPIERMTVDSVWVNPTLDPALFSPPKVAERPIAWRGGSGAVRAPFAYDARAVLVKVSINGAPPADFILDTGASMTAIDRDYAETLGLTPEGKASTQGIAASAEMQFARVGSIALAADSSASAGLRDFRVALLDLAKGSEAMLWRKPAGLLGADFLSRFVLELDYDSLTVTLTDPARFEYRGGGAGIPFELHAGVPVVQMTLNGGCSGRFLVDVGNSFQFVVHGSSVRSCQLFNRGPRREVEVEGGGVGGGFEATLCRLDSLRIGPYSCAQPVAALTLHSQGGIGSKEFAGNIGNTVLERFRCTFDYPHRTLYLEPGQRFAEREHVSRVGAMFARVGDDVMAGTILHGSAAYDAGLRWYDKIVAIDDRPLDQWTREELDRVLAEGAVGSVHRITYRRLDEPEATVEVKLKDVL